MKKMIGSPEEQISLGETNERIDLLLEKSQSEMNVLRMSLRSKHIFNFPLCLGRVKPKRSIAQYEYSY